VRFILHIGEGKLALNQSMMGLYDLNERVCGQIIFKEHYPEAKTYTAERRSCTEFVYTTEEDAFIRIKFLVGVFDAKKMKYEEVLAKYEEYFRNPHQIVTDLPTIAWNYLEMTKEYNISFIVCRDKEIYPKFSNDPNFQVVYNSVNEFMHAEVAIFKVVENK